MDGSSALSVDSFGLTFSVWADFLHYVSNDEGVEVIVFESLQWR